MLTSSDALRDARPTLKEATARGSYLAALEAQHAGAPDAERAASLVRYGRLWEALSAWIDDGVTPRPADAPDVAPRLVSALAGVCLQTYSATPPEARAEVLPAFVGAQIALEAWLCAPA
ncbi:hypothetical protein ET495_04150 [Xylanimonas allomyrinae]|uniref:Uncharacterized protein n=1 Tax=Xylanimonas allomyrinae TaxID=2509459 RepID=A0A4P6EJB2_9MICO|nr:hypothetical protein [Xylanimonas allomyrinae]QAY62574.1 hypothetical protein ET495_04150 [Xylanimonas allomyrinae]